MVVVSDAKANVASRPGYGAVLAELDRVTRSLCANERLRSLVLDATDDGKDDRAAAWLAEALNAPRLKVHRFQDLSTAAIRELFRQI